MQPKRSDVLPLTTSLSLRPLRSGTLLCPSEEKYRKHWNSPRALDEMGPVNELGVHRVGLVLEEVVLSSPNLPCLAPPALSDIVSYGGGTSILYFVTREERCEAGL